MRDQTCYFKVIGGTPMKTMLLATVLCLALIPRGGSAQTGQGSTAPFTRQELAGQLREAEARRISQADIASEVNRRGIDFKADEKALSEFRRAGARSFLLDAIQRAGQNPGRPQIADPVATPDETRPPEGEIDISKLPILEQARRHALEFADELPNFIVTQVVARYARTPEDKDWKLEDKLEIELTYRSGKGEELKLLRVNGKPTPHSYEDVGGSTSTGEFGSILAALFVPQSKAEFKEVKRETFRGRPTIVYEFKVKKANSNSSISEKSSGKTIVAGYSGSIWIDLESKQTLRIEETHDGIPAGFPVSLSENAVEYDFVKIGGESYLLPVRAEVLLGEDAKRIYTRNVIDFSGYRKFEAKIKIDPN